MKVSSFGEVLWDDFPSGKILGGAPLNVIVRLRALGADCSIISRCGDDKDGEALLQQIRSRNIPTDLIQIDSEYATSLVKVAIDVKGCPTYDIVYPCAWDKIEATQVAIEQVAQSDVFVYGSLSVRDKVSRHTLNQLIKVAKLRVFDINLRKPHYNPDNILDMMKQADVVKMNDEEIYELAKYYGSPYHSLSQHIHYLAELSNTKHFCVTLGRHGATYLCEGKLYTHHGFKVSVIDTVGAGDNFLAGFIYQFMNKAHPEQTLAFACALGALTSSFAGATPNIHLDDILHFMDPVKHSKK